MSQERRQARAEKSILGIELEYVLTWEYPLQCVNSPFAIIK